MSRLLIMSISYKIACPLINVSDQPAQIHAQTSVIACVDAQANLCLRRAHKQSCKTFFVPAQLLFVYLFVCHCKFFMYFSGVAGLDNLDLMTKTLDRANRFKLPMSVGGMTTNRLRMLMAAAGRKRK